MMMVCVLSAVAGNVYKVKYVVIESYERGTYVYCTDSKVLSSSLQRQYTSFFNSLQAGDLIEVEFKPFTPDCIIAIRKIGHEAPEGMTNGVIVENNGNGYGYYGGGYGAASIETKNVGVGYDPNTGIHLRVKGNYVNLPIRFKSRRSNENTAVYNDNVVVTAGPATRVVSTESASRQATVRTSQTRRTSFVSAPAKAKKSSSYDLASSPSRMF